MTANGWVQIAIYCAVIIAVTRPFGGYMTRVFNGERTLFSPVLRPVERGGLLVLRRRREGRAALADLCGGDAVLQRRRLLVALCIAAAPGRAAVQSGRVRRAVEESLAFNTAVSFVTNTNWQSYSPETTMSYLDPDGRAHGAQFPLGRHRHRAGHRASIRGFARR